MTTFSKLLALLSLVVSVSAGSLVLHERRTTVPSGFVRHGAAPATDTITLRIALKPNNVAGLEEKLRSVATPGSSEFQKWLSRDDVLTFTKPSSETLSVFDAFASANGLSPTAISQGGDWVSIALPISKANKLFAANFELFTHPSLNEPITRTLSVSLPSELVGHVDVLHPTTAFIAPNPRLAPPRPGYKIRKRGVPAASCDSTDPAGVVTPTCLQDLYGIPTTPVTHSGGSNNTIMVTGYENDWAQTADLVQFLTLARPDISNATGFTVLTTANGTNPQGPGKGGFEANLDIQYTAGIATGIPLQYLSVGGEFTTALLDTTNFLNSLTDLPTVITNSWGVAEDGFGVSLATSICNGYMALGARGVSVIFASGDGGVRGAHGGVCTNNTFNPIFPASCGYVTSVGGTQGFAPETAVNFTGGGFSNLFPAPSYQTTAVSEFLATLTPDFAGIFNKSGRAHPDVALQAWNFETIVNGEVNIEGGTSAAAPTFAAIIALINDRLLAAGKPVLGFLNPWLYERASGAFTDITTGHSSGYRCAANETVAFDAAVGWDPLTGFGTPIFSELLKTAL
ncbi:subtilisin-like protein, partial [Mycena olivaceomarginata]